MTPSESDAQRKLHITIHARPATLQPAEIISTSNNRIQTYCFRQSDAAFELTFEEAFTRLDSLSRMHVELDGSLAWASSDPHEDWRIAGSIFDRNNRVLYLELKGWMPEIACNRLLEKLGWPETAVVFQLVREAVYLDEAGFRLFAYG